MPLYDTINLHPASHLPSTLTSTTWDVICLGSGWAGRVIAARLVKAGYTGLVVENELVGGDCPFWACVPSKVLLRPQEALDEFRGVPSLGGRVSGGVDAQAVFSTRDNMASNWDDQDHLIPIVEGAGVQIVRGVGKLAGEKKVQVDAPNGSTITLTAKHAVVISTGSESIIPDIPGLAEANPWTPRHATSSSSVPAHLVVLGAGAVGCEMATAYMSFGSRVTLISNTPEILARVPPEAGKLVREALNARGAVVHLSTTATKVTHDDNGITVELANGETLQADRILVSMGRKPNSRGLGLELFDLPSEGGYIAVDETLRVKSVPGNWLYAAGDVNGRHPLTHGSKYHGRVIAADILAKIGGKGSVSDKWARTSATADLLAMPQVIFTNPVVASVGLTEHSAKKAGLSVRTITAVAKTLGGAIRNQNMGTGWAEWVLEEGTDRLVGATFVGQGVEDLIHGSTVAIVGEMTLDRLAHAVPCFPTMSEIYLNLLEAAGI